MIRVEVTAVREVELRCAYCHDALASDLRRCRCGTALHRDCAASLGTCPVMGCGGRFPASARERPIRSPWWIHPIAFLVLLLGLVVGLVLGLPGLFLLATEAEVVLHPALAGIGAAACVLGYWRLPRWGSRLALAGLGGMSVSVMAVAAWLGELFERLA